MRSTVSYFTLQIQGMDREGGILLRFIHFRMILKAQKMIHSCGMPCLRGLADQKRLLSKFDRKQTC